MNKTVITCASFLLIISNSCKERSPAPSAEAINQINLKRGNIILCGPADKQFGAASFSTSCSDAVKEDFTLGIELLHSFEYDEAEKTFAKVIDKDPACAMAYWGVAMSNFHPLWTPPSEPELKKGSAAIEIATTLKSSPRESAYIDAIASFYSDWKNKDHLTRTQDFENGMENVYKNFPDDKEAAIFYSLALDAAADPNDKSFTKQKKAGKILQSLYPGQPDHPGIAHYIIHTYDYPELALQGLDAARKYAFIAPSSAHALHMPSHIFTRLGLWNDCIQSNLASVASAKCYAETAGIKGHWDEELHGIDYLMYAYLQKGDNDSAKIQWHYLNTITDVSPVNFKVAYAFAAVPSRYLLENRMWKDAAVLKAGPEDFQWSKFPWQEAIIHFTRSLGASHTGNIESANIELKELTRLHDTLMNLKDTYKANQVAIQMKSAEAWIRLKEGKKEEALSLMQAAADMEDKTEKHPVTPGEVLPARELLGDMLLQLNNPDKALQAYEADLKNRPNRFNALYGAAVAAGKSGNTQMATAYYQRLASVVGDSKSDRIEVQRAREYAKSLSRR